MRQKLTTVLSAVATSTAIRSDGEGYLSNVGVVADIYATGAAFVGSAQWQTSPDNITWTNTGVAFAGGTFNTQNLTLNEYTRLNATAFTSGPIQGRFFTDI